MLRQWTDKLVDASGRRPLRVLLPALALLVATWAFASRLELRSDLRELLPRDSPSYAAFEHQLGRLGGGASLIVVVQSPNRTANERLIDAIGGRLDAEMAAPEGASGAGNTLRTLVSQVEANAKDLRTFFDQRKWLYPSLPELEKAEQDLDFAVASRSGLVEDLEEGEAAPKGASDAKAAAFPAPAHAELARGARIFDDFPTGYFEGADGTTAALRIISASAGTGDRLGDELFDRVEKMVADVHPESFEASMRVGYAGDIPNAIEEKKSLVGDAFFATALALLLVLLGVAWFFRSWRALVVIGLPAWFGVGCAYAFATATFGYVNTTGAFLGAIIVGNGINYPIVLLSRYREFVRDGQPKEAAKRNAVANAFRAELVGACVGSIAYGSLVVTRFRGFSQFGWIGFVGMLAVWAATIVVVPAMTAFFERGGRTLWDDRPSKSVVMDWLARVVPRHRTPIMVAALAIVAFASVKLPRYLADPWEYDFDKLGSRGSKSEGAGHWSNVADAIFGKMNIAGASMLADTPEQVPGLKQKILANDAADPQGRLIADIVTIDDFLPGPIEDQQKKIEILERIKKRLSPSFLARLSTDDRAKAEASRPPEALATVGAAELPMLVRRRFQEKNDRLGTVFYVRYKDSVSLSDGHNLLRIAKSSDNVTLPDGTEVKTASRATIFAELIRSLERDGPLSTAVSFGAVLIVMFVATHTKKGALAVLASLLGGVLIMVGGAALMGNKLNFLNFIALPITFGIGCEYPFNIYDRSRLLDGDVSAALRRSGGAVALCSYTTVIGYGALIFADNQALQSFGWMAISGEVACIAMALLVLPALLAKRAPAQIEAPVPEATAPPSST